jgi:hypothetical protein
MRCRAFGVAIFIGITIWSWGQVTIPASTKLTAPLQPVIEVLYRANVSGSLEVSRCDFGPPPHLPNLRVPTATGPLPQVLREMFADDPVMRVTQDRDGTIRMIESGVPTDLLNVRIRHLPFELKGIPLQYAAFTPFDALQAILQTPEVLAFAKANGIVIPPPGGGIMGPSDHLADSPHIVGSMDDLTLSQALDRVLKAFPGIWVYEDCPCSDRKSRCPFFWFFNMGNPGLIQEE